jgi:hypothetical protein
MKFKDCATLIWCGGVYGRYDIQNNDQNQEWGVDGWSSNSPCFAEIVLNLHEIQRDALCWRRICFGVYVFCEGCSIHFYISGQVLVRNSVFRTGINFTFGAWCRLWET